ncbi:hypothetical protein OEZ86_002073 [Tetradesmus obliquus]|nr:hypothetical protein OEZ86_002073 [Tetradesmus obliquus]
MAEASIPAAVMPAAAEVQGEVPAAAIQVHSGTPSAPAATPYSPILGTSLALDQIHKVKMHVAGSCSMGISFWPSFSFKPPEREAQAGTVTLVPNTAANHPAASSAAAAAADVQGGSSSGNGGAPGDTAPAAAAAAEGETAGARPPCSCSHLLHINFTRAPPDEVSTGAKLLGCIPFPFLTIRTNKLEGTIDPCSGAVTLQFEAAMLAQVGSRPPTPLPLATCLTSERASAVKVTLQGKRLADGRVTEPAAACKVTPQGKQLADGRVTLVSAAEVPKTGSSLANLILWLPTAATAVLPMRLEFLQ